MFLPGRAYRHAGFLDVDIYIRAVLQQDLSGSLLRVMYPYQRRSRGWASTEKDEVYVPATRYSQWREIRDDA
jgi:hypothetical protein